MWAMAANGGLQPNPSAGPRQQPHRSGQFTGKSSATRPGFALDLARRGTRKRRPHRPRTALNTEAGDPVNQPSPMAETRRASPSSTRVIPSSIPFDERWALRRRD